jgi:hypothetical protein
VPSLGKYLGTVKSKEFWIVSGSVAAVIAIPVAFVVPIVEHHRGPGPEPSPSATATLKSLPPPAPPAPPSPSTRPIAIDPIGPNVPECTTVTGTGDVPNDNQLWLLVKSNEPKYYFFQTQPNATDHTWKAPNVQVGADNDPAGEPFTIYAALLTEDTARAINGSNNYANGVNSPPSGVTLLKGEVHVQRTSDHTPCPPS